MKLKKSVKFGYQNVFNCKKTGKSGQVDENNY